jgi:hypothetical protein
MNKELAYRLRRDFDRILRTVRFSLMFSIQKYDRRQSESIMNPARNSAYRTLIKDVVCEKLSDE